MTPLAPTAHHPLGPSTWPARSECAKFDPIPDVDLEDVDGDGEDDSEDTTARGRGQAMHKAVAMLLVGDLATRQRALVGLSDREINQVQWVAAKARELVESNGYSVDELRVEQRVTMLKPESFEPLYFGTGDGEAGPLDFDWKFAERRNYFMQLVGYALPKMEDRNEPRRYGFILNGRYKVVERYVLERKTVQTLAYSLLSRVMSPDSRPTPCSYCGFCARVATCPALVATPVQLVERREDWVMKLPSPHVSQLTHPAWVGAARYIWKTCLEPWGKAVEFASSSMAANGITPAGFKVQSQKGRTTIGDMQKAFAALKDTIGEDVLWNNMSAWIGSLAKAWAEKAGISEDKAKSIIISKLTDAGAIATGAPVVKLVREKNAEDLIRAAIAKPFVPEVPEKGVDLNPSAVPHENSPEGAGV